MFLTHLLVLNSFKTISFLPLYPLYFLVIPGREIQAVLRQEEGFLLNFIFIPEYLYSVTTAFL